MDIFQSAVGLKPGRVDTDAGGLARFSLQINVPPGTGHGNEPNLSLQYCQGCPNGSLGAGWALGGMSSIRKTPSSLAFDGVNIPPPDYNIFTPKLALDGNELLNIQGNYGDSNANYTTEIDSEGRIVKHSGAGFVCTDNKGRSLEYGTTSDSQVWMSDKKSIREWKLKKQTDLHGNDVTYTYVSTPAGAPAGADINTCYLSQIAYASNTSARQSPARVVQFEYSTRSDLVVQSVQGDIATWASLLSAIHVGVVQNSITQISRSYELSYLTSAATGDSCLSSIIETSGTGTDKVQLLPHRFTYTSPGVSPNDFFTPPPPAPVLLENSTNSVFLMTLNISGRSMSDIASLIVDPSANTLNSVKTYLAEKQTDGTTTWNESLKPNGVVDLPPIDVSGGLPDILTPDINNDGRSGLLIPCQDSDNLLQFSLSESVGVGFSNYTLKKTVYNWIAGSKFIAADLTGRHTTDVVQIFEEDGKLSFRTFVDIKTNDNETLVDCKYSATSVDYAGTIDWFLLSDAVTKATSLVRIWSQNEDLDGTDIMATVFTADTDPQSTEAFLTGMDSLLEENISIDASKYHVVPCDINADGFQDLVLATIEFGSDLTFQYSTYIGDGRGLFRKHLTTAERIAKDAPEPLMQNDSGRNGGGSFFTTNLNGSNYPSICYVYQNRETRGYTCISVDGQSNGLVSNPTIFELTQDLNATQTMDIVPTDFDGNGMGDWLFWCIDSGQPSVYPVSNKAKVADFLSSATDPMGLVTTLSYGALSDPQVYTSAVSWEDYTNTSKDSYPLIAAPNYVVTRIHHSNDSSINSFPYELSIKKTYGSATINTKGRDWQGFARITSLNETDKISTRELYHPQWPLTGQKVQADTMTSDGKTWKSELADFKATYTQKGSWKIYRVDKISEEIATWDNQQIVRTVASSYTYDAFGNTTCKRSWDGLRNQIRHESWELCSFTTVNGIANLMTGKKVTSNKNNTNMSTFENGDGSLLIFEYDQNTATMNSVSEWSTDTQDFVKTTFSHDAFGNETQSVDSMGLKTTTTYDSVFNSFPVKRIVAGEGVNEHSLGSFGVTNGQQVARLGEDGSLACHHIDPFGRVLETRLRSPDQGGSSLTGLAFLPTHSQVTCSDLSSILAKTVLNPCKRLTFSRQKGVSGKSYLQTEMLSYSKDGADGQTQIIELTDCMGRIRRRFTRHGQQAEKTALAWEYDARGHRIFESFPTQLPSSTDLSWEPDRSRGSVSTYDAIGRPISHQCPSNTGTGVALSTKTYLDGGARVQDKVFSNSQLLTTVEKSLVSIHKRDFVTSMTDENGLCSTYKYDISGNLLLVIDPAGKQESRTYNSRNMLLTLNNKYQNTSSAAFATKYQYNGGNHLVQETNALGEIIMYSRDAKGRVLKKLGQDGRTIAYAYGDINSDKPSSIAILAKGSALESKFDFTYDIQGRIVRRKLTLADGTNFTTSLSYNWQDEIIKKTLPDGSIVSSEYCGTLLTSSKMTSSNGSDWSLQADITKCHATEFPEQMTVSGIGINQFKFTWQYDSNGHCLSHALLSGATSLVQENYQYNDLDQLVQKTEQLSGTSTKYAYHGRRLASSLSNNVSTSYEFDASGNMTRRGDTCISATDGSVIGQENGTNVFNVNYDRAGRMVKKSANGQQMDFTYDTFGNLKSWGDSSGGSTSQIITDFTGETLSQRHAGGSSDLMVDSNFVIHTEANGSKTTRYKHFIGKRLVGTLSSAINPANISVHPVFTDTKGNVTRIYDGKDVSQCQILQYDDFGLLQSSSTVEDDTGATYEGKRLDTVSGLVDFGGRWYDPFVGRFATPDDIVDLEILMRTDGLNRFAFENNDPINHTDPTGHWTLSSGFGLAIGITMVVAAVAVTVATDGAGAPLAAAAVGALGAGGTAGIEYSVTHRDEQDSGKFLGGFFTTVAINAAIGAATGAAGAFATPARAVAATSRLAVFGSTMTKAYVGASASILTSASDRFVSNAFYGTHYDCFGDNVIPSLESGVFSGMVGGYMSRNSGNLDGWVRSRAVAGVWQKEAVRTNGIWKYMPLLKQVGKTAASKSIGAASFGYKQTGLDVKVNNMLRDFAQGVLPPHQGY